MRRFPRSVMVVDDDPDARELLRIALEREEPGCVVTEAVSGEDALCRLAGGAHPDVVVTDLQMPGAFHGIHVTDECRARGIPAVVVTSFPSLSPLGVRCVDKRSLLTSRILPTLPPPPAGVPAPLIFGVLALAAALVALATDDGRGGSAMASGRSHGNERAIVATGRE